MVDAGGVITYQATAFASALKTPDEVVSQVSSELSGMGLPVRNWATSTPSLLTQAEAAAAFFEPFEFQVTMEVQNQTGLAFAQPDDMASIINHAFYDVTGFLPSAFSVPTVSNPGSTPTATGEPTAPGAPSPSASPVTPQGGTLSGFEAKVGGFFSGLTSTVSLALGLAAVGLLIGIVLVKQGRV